MINGEKNIIRKVVRFYVDGFRNMASWGQQLWWIILIKLFIMFAVLKLFFFPNFLNTNFSTDEERSDYVIERMTNPNHGTDQEKETNTTN
jgi:hypothetical protein